jgi:hypothetical protein
MKNDSMKQYGYNLTGVENDLIVIGEIKALLNSEAYNALRLSFEQVQNLITNNEVEIKRLRLAYTNQFANRYPEIEPERLSQMVRFPYEAELRRYPQQFKIILNNIALWHDRDKYLTESNGQYKVRENIRTLLEQKHGYQLKNGFEPVIETLTKLKDLFQELHKLLPDNYIVQNQYLRMWLNNFFVDTYKPPADWEFREMSGITLRKRE